MSAHTPSPWSVRVERKAMENSSARFFIEAKRLVLAETKALPPRLTDEAEANAHLIAAAPDLLAALKNLVAANEQWNTEVESVIGRPTHWTDSYLDAARAAIQKAEDQ